MAYGTKVKMENGNPTSTVWCRERKHKNGSVYYGGTYTKSTGEKVFISVNPNPVTITDRKGGQSMAVPVKIVKLPKYNNNANAF